MLIKERLYNPTCSIERQQLELLKSEGDTIVSAPRPLYGRSSWQGNWCAGTFWASGNLNEYQQSWEESDATIVILVSNESLIQLAEQEYHLKVDEYQGTGLILPTLEELKAKHNNRDFVKKLLPTAPWNVEIAV